MDGQKVIDEIADGKFFPDSQRSGFFKKFAPGQDVGPSADLKSVHRACDESAMSELYVDESCPGQIDDATANETGELKHVADAVDSDVSISSAESDGELTSMDSDEEVPQPGEKVRAKIPAEESGFVHRRSHLVHHFAGTEHYGQKFLVCGKLLTDVYSPCTEARAPNMLCKSCNRR